MRMSRRVWMWSRFRRASGNASLRKRDYMRNAGAESAGLLLASLASPGSSDPSSIVRRWDQTPSIPPHSNE